MTSSTFLILFNIQMVYTDAQYVNGLSENRYRIKCRHKLNLYIVITLILYKRNLFLYKDIKWKHIMHQHRKESNEMESAKCGT